MADFMSAFLVVKDRMEGGDVLTNNPLDKGKETYSGISRAKNPQWIGWSKVDKKEFDDSLKSLVKTFYKEEYWDKFQGDIIGFQSVAFNLFAYGVNAGIETSIRMCQRILKIKPDGIFGKDTLKALNLKVQDSKDEKSFVLEFCILQLLRYGSIAEHDVRRKHDKVVSDLGNLPGWINRVEYGLEYWGIRYP
jgi:lysozyme family protein